MGLRLVLASLFLVTAGCSGEAPTDNDPVRADGGAETSTEEDTAGEPNDTGTAPEDAADTATAGDTASDVSADTRPTCPTVDNEPNNSIPSASILKEIDDCDGSGGSFKGVVAGGSDADFFTYKGNDTTLCRTDVTASTKTAGVRLCAFVSCAAGTTEIKNCVKGTKATSPGGVNGCCADGPGDVEVEHTCPLVGADDSAQIYMRVDAPGSAAMCTNYEVTYHF